MKINFMKNQQMKKKTFFDYTLLLTSTKLLTFNNELENVLENFALLNGKHIFFRFTLFLFSNILDLMKITIQSLKFFIRKHF